MLVISLTLSWVMSQQGPSVRTLFLSITKLNTQWWKDNANIFLRTCETHVVSCEAWSDFFMKMVPQFSIFPIQEKNLYGLECYKDSLKSCFGIRSTTINSYERIERITAQDREAVIFCYHGQQRFLNKFTCACVLPTCI